MPQTHENEAGHSVRISFVRGPCCVIIVSAPLLKSLDCSCGTWGKIELDRTAPPTELWDQTDKKRSHEISSLQHLFTVLLRICTSTGHSLFCNCQFCALRLSRWKPYLLTLTLSILQISLYPKARVNTARFSNLHLDKHLPTPSTPHINLHNGRYCA